MNQHTSRKCLRASRPAVRPSRLHPGIGGSRLDGMPDDSRTWLGCGSGSTCSTTEAAYRVCDYRAGQIQSVWVRLRPKWKRRIELLPPWADVPNADLAAHV